MKVRSGLLALAIAAVGISPISSSLFASFAFDAAYADNDNGNGNGNGNGNENGNGNGNGNGNSNGALASELKGLNAANANENALLNASANSRVGKIAAYKEAALASDAAAVVVEQAESALAGLAEPTRNIEEIEAAIAALDPLAEGYAEALALLQTELSATQDYAEALQAVADALLALGAAEATENDSLLIASDGRVLSDAALAELRALLDL